MEPARHSIVGRHQPGWINRQRVADHPERGLQQRIVQARVVPVQIAAGDRHEPAVQVSNSVTRVVHQPDLSVTLAHRNISAPPIGG